MVTVFKKNWLGKEEPGADIGSVLVPVLGVLAYIFTRIWMVALIRLSSG